MSNILGIDIGGSGIKGAIVNIDTGTFVSDYLRIPTPSEAHPDKVAEIIIYIKEQLSYKGPIGIGVPGPIKEGAILRAINLSKQWQQFEVASYFAKELGQNDLYFLNDADAAAIAEYRFGGWPDTDSTVIFLTLGTGIGSCIVDQGHFIYNTELGHLRFRKKQTFEQYASNSARKKEDLSWRKYGERLNELLELYNHYFSNPYFVIGGGLIKRKERFAQYISPTIKWKGAELQNNAGIIGAAIRTTM